MSSHEQGGEALADGDGFIDGTGGTFAEHADALGDAAEIADDGVELGEHRRLAVCGEQFTAGDDMALFELGEICFESSGLPGFGLAQGIEKEVGDLGHGGDDDGDGALFMLFGADLAGGAHTVG